MKNYHKSANDCHRLLRILACATAIAMLVLMLIRVVRRYCFGRTLIWPDEVTYYLLIYRTFLGGAAAHYQKALVSLDLVASRPPTKMQETLKLINNTICLIFSVSLIYFSIQKVISPSAVNNVSNASGLSLVVPYCAIPIGLIFMFIFATDFFPDSTRGVREAFQEDKKTIVEGREKEGDKVC